MNYAGVEKLAEGYNQCDKIEEEKAVQAKLQSRTLERTERTHPLTVLCCPEEILANSDTEEMTLGLNQASVLMEHSVQAIVPDNTCMKARHVEIRTKNCQIQRTEVTPVVPLPHIRLKTQLTFPSKPLIIPKYKPHETPKLKIKFSTCTVVYKPAQPVYETFKERRSSGQGLFIKTTAQQRRSKSYF